MDRTMHDTASSTHSGPRAWAGWLLLTGLIWLIGLPQAHADFPFSFGGTGDEEVVDVATDAFGNLIVLGSFTGLTQIDDPNGGIGPFIFSSYGQRDVFVAKFSLDGKLQWARHAGSSNDDVPRALTIDAGGDIYITGVYDRYLLNFYGPGGKPFMQLEGINGDQLDFLAKLDASGEWQWAKQLGKEGRVDQLFQRLAHDTESDVAAALLGGGVIFAGDRIIRLGSDGNTLWTVNPDGLLLTDEFSGYIRFERVAIGAADRDGAVIEDEIFFVLGYAYRPPSYNKLSAEICGKSVPLGDSFIMAYKEIINAQGEKQATCKWIKNLGVQPKYTASHYKGSTYNYPQPYPSSLTTDGKGDVYWQDANGIIRKYYAVNGNLAWENMEHVWFDVGVMGTDERAGSSIAVDSGLNVYAARATLADWNTTRTSPKPRALRLDQVSEPTPAANTKWFKGTEIGLERGNARLTLGATGTAYFVGSFKGTVKFSVEQFGVDSDITLTASSEDIFIALLNTESGELITPRTWTVGQRIEAPAGALKDKQPEILIEGLDQQDVSQYFYWSALLSADGGGLYPIGEPPGLVTLQWKVSDVVTDETRILSTGSVGLPSSDQIQYHAAGSPVRLEPAHVPSDTDAPLRFSSVVYPPRGLSLVTTDPTQGPVFQRSLPVTGESPYVVLQYFKTGTADAAVNPQDQAPYFIVVETVDAQEAPVAAHTEYVLIGSPITSGLHEDTDANGYVVSAKAPIDAAGVSKAYDRATRLGPIIPVNEQLDAAHPLVVAWYTKSPEGVLWPDQAVRYIPGWPDDVQPIVIADQQGSGPLSAEMASGQIYNQPDQALPGFNPNEEHALLIKDGDTDTVVFALRDDLNAFGLSKPYVLLKYRDATDSWAFKVFKVCATQDSPLCENDPAAMGRFEPTDMDADPDNGNELYSLTAGTLVQPPRPLINLPVCAESSVAADPAQAGWQDHNGNLWARAANGSDYTNLRYYYPLQNGFYFDFDDKAGSDVAIGTCIPWLAGKDNYIKGPAIDVAYEFKWPDEVPVLHPGESLLSAKNGLPTINGQKAAQIVFDELTYADTNGGKESYTSHTKSLALLYDPVSERKVDLDKLPTDVSTTTRNGRTYFPDLPFTLRSRLSYDATNQWLLFGGSIDEPETVGDSHLLPNIMTATELKRILTDLGDNENCTTDLCNAVTALYHKTRNPYDLSLNADNDADQRYLVGLMPTEPDDTRLTDWKADAVDKQSLYDVPMVLSAGRTGLVPLDPTKPIDEQPATAGKRYLTLAFNNDERLNLPVSLEVIQVDETVYPGHLWVVPSDNVFEESLTLRHSGDFGGDPDCFDFDWYYQPDTAGQPEAPTADSPELPWVLSNTGAGLIDITIEGPGLRTLSDNWFVARYRRATDADGLVTCLDVSDVFETSSAWAGDPAWTSPVKAMLATGWIKRVVAGLNPFDSRVSDFHDNAASTLTSMVSQLGKPYAGAIPFNPDGDVINSVGLIEAYETVLRRGRMLSIDAGIKDIAANTQLLNAATRIGDFYTLLGNEAYADAADPTIGFDTGSALGSRASSLFTFENVVASPLEEELDLLRGRDDSATGVQGYPIFNRLFWNFTQGDGEVAYVQSYGITDQNADGFITEKDASLLFPQGHGDAWGHYLTALTERYDLLRHTNFTWVPRPESVLVGGAVIQVDYLDERKFATAAAAKARAGAEIVNLTYREQYVEDPDGQWQGYKDTDTERAWGLDGWGRRAGQGAYFDWLTANAILPHEDPDPTHTGIQKVDRASVPELGQIVGQFNAIQGQMDQADAGVNPLGLAKGVVPFDIDPTFDTPGSAVQGQTHFEQVAARARTALDNAVTVFDHASQQSQSLRQVQDDVDQLTRLVREQERAYKNRLIEIFGYPYGGDTTYPSGYDGPDLYHYMYVSSGLTGELPQPDGEFTGFYTPLSFGREGASHFFPADLSTADYQDDNAIKEVDYPIATGADWEFIATAAWGKRRAPGELQDAISNILQGQAAFQRALKEHANHLAQIDATKTLIEAEYFNQLKTTELYEDYQGTLRSLDDVIYGAKIAELALKRIGTVTRDLVEAAKEGIPKVAGFSNDVCAPARAAVLFAGFALANVFEIGGDIAEGEGFRLDLAKGRAEKQLEMDLYCDTNNMELMDRVADLEQLWRDEAPLRLAIFTQAEAVQQSLGRYQQLLAEGERLMEERRLFRINAAADTQEYRYRDMTFRIFRNDALQKYRAQFDLAARYIYLAATAYDYETNMLGDASGAGRDFLADIVRQRSLGQVDNGVPIAGSSGLADVLARLTQNFAVYKGQLGFNNPQTETNRFSLRRELFRLRDDSDQAWREALKRAYVENLWDLPEFRRYARPFTLESQGPQPALVFRFPTTVTFGLNFFGWPLGGGDSAYDPTYFATKVRSVGTWFTNYDGTALSNTPRIYLLPVGLDVLRSPTGDTLATREWQILDQAVPVPFPIGTSDLTDPSWIPGNDSLSEPYGDIRRYSSYRAYHDSGRFSPSEAITNSRLIGRSVWNTDWMLIIPGGTLLNDANKGLAQFIDGQLVPGSKDERDGQGVSDIKLFFQTYGYSGN